ncbi:MAG TPA: lysophospholipid acyltransferase family protein, partial [Candidatus Thermoplasmatota archaeon]|nr:lysophospholipid acyltransferase family protein [Candidatus Thermoplasmatota archaeon]
YTVSWYLTTPVVRTLFRTRFEGREHVPKKGPAIIASNHLSFLDHLIVGISIPRQIYFISKDQHFDYPIRRFLFSRWGVIPLKRGEGDQEAFQKSAEVIERGNVFCIYPEGTRSLDGRLHKGHTGVARLAAITKAPVVPVAMLGTFEAMPKGKSVPRLVKCGARFGPALDFSSYHGKENDRDAMRKVTDEIMEAIQKLSGQDYVDAYQFNPEVKTHAKPAQG